jgi:arabinofuranosyltransferase
VDLFRTRSEKSALVISSLGFVVWSAIFIYRSSFIAIDGKRYFCLFDDAMISMRYAWNFSHGTGLIWNAGERVQGFSNLLMTLLMAIATLIFSKSSASLFIQILGVVVLLTIAFLCIKLSESVFHQDEISPCIFSRVLIFLSVLSYYPLLFWSLMGMETGLLTMLLLFGILQAFEFVRNKNSTPLFLVSGSLGFAFLSRNDSIIVAFLIFISLLSKII